MKNKIICGDCIQEMKKLPESSVDAIVTDPPYELGFMGKKWDASGIAYNVDMWKECLRVLKSGGFLLSFGGTRTYHRMACGIEDAGFEIRDCIQWLYGSGFPKSLSIGKQIDKLQGNKRKMIGIDEDFLRRNSKSNHKDDYKESYGNPSYKDGKEGAIRTKGTSKWEGYGTALKPANEPIVVARKPLSEKNVALNVLKWGTGGINIDGCRIESNRKDTRHGGGIKSDKIQQLKPDAKGYELPQGRFPSNIIFDEEAARLLDAQSGITISKDTIRYNKLKGGTSYYKESGFNPINTSGFNDSGGASRFFYVAKASRSERNAGCERLKEKYQDESRKIGSAGGTNPRNRGAEKPLNNFHPTVKPIKLMQYLIRLVTPKGGTVLDPFMGSGTTGIAALEENVNFIGIEKDKEYIKIANARLEFWQKPKDQRDKVLKELEIIEAVNQIKDQTKLGDYK